MRLPLLVGFFLFTLPSGAFGELLLGLTTANALVRFDSATPGTFLGPAIPITGIIGGDTIVAIDRRPITGQVFALGVSGTTARLYTVDVTTGAATLLGTVALPQSGGVSGAGTTFGVDINPVVDRIRVVANNGDNFRLNPDTGALAGADVALNPGTPVVVGVAYTSNFVGASSTTLFAIDTSTNPDQLVFIGGNPVPPGSSPNGGVLTVVGSLGVNTSSNDIGFEISSSGQAFASLQVGGTSGLYTINLSSGGASLIGSFSGGTTIRGLTTADAAVPVLSPLALAVAASLIVSTAVVLLKRRLALNLNG